MKNGLVAFFVRDAMQDDFNAGGFAMTYIIRMFGAALIVLIVTISTALTETFFYVANTRPPDAFLALRTEPSSLKGSRIMTLPNGTLLRVLQRRPDGWWLVREVQSNAEGWVLSQQGARVWIECCKHHESLVSDPTVTINNHPKNDCLLEVEGTIQYKGPCQITRYGDGGFRIDTPSLVATVNVIDASKAIASWQWKPINSDDYVRNEYGVTYANELGIGRIDYDDMPDYQHCWGSEAALSQGQEEYTNVCITLGR